jgi:tRNA-specific 2-thiouridylase
VNFSQEYWQNVFSLFLDEYRAGRTPNPDILCNQEIKFKAFLDHALKLGADAIATGHYALIGSDSDSSRDCRGRPLWRPDMPNAQLLKGADPNKDQSYFLYTITQHALNHALFPIGHLTKPEVRAIAQSAGLINHAKKDSTGICFIGKRPFRAFLNDYLPAEPGEIQTPDGKRLGEHAGLIFYTLGQRQGIGIGGQKEAAAAPWYVVGKDIGQNILYVTQDPEHPWNISRELNASDFHWISGKAPCETITCFAKVRYRQTEVACIVSPTNNHLMRVCFPDPQKSVTPGQSIVLYQGNVCLGGGIIHSTDAPGATHIPKKEIIRC